jgi:hypothetical protein
VAGNAVRFRMLHPDGLGGFPDDVWTINGHVWQEEPYVTVGNVSSATIGNNLNSQWFGARDGFGPGNHFDIVLASAGGRNKVSGDYLYKSFPVGEFATGGNWGLFRVNATPKDQLTCLTGGTPKLMALPSVHPHAIPEAIEKVHPAKKDPQERFLNRKAPAKAAEEKEEETPEPPKP